MVSQCANPNCGAPFVYLRSGRLFEVPRQSAPETRATVEYFWLCERCAEILQPDFCASAPHFTLVARPSRGHHYR